MFVAVLCYLIYFKDLCMITGMWTIGRPALSPQGHHQKCILRTIHPYSLTKKVLHSKLNFTVKIVKSI